MEIIQCYGNLLSATASKEGQTKQYIGFEKHLKEIPYTLENCNRENTWIVGQYVMHHLTMVPFHLLVNYKDINDLWPLCPMCFLECGLNSRESRHQANFRPHLFTISCFVSAVFIAHYHFDTLSHAMILLSLHSIQIVYYVLCRQYQTFLNTVCCIQLQYNELFSQGHIEVTTSKKTE